MGRKVHPACGDVDKAWTGAKASSSLHSYSCQFSCHSAPDPLNSCSPENCLCSHNFKSYSNVYFFISQTSEFI